MFSRSEMEDGTSELYSESSYSEGSSAMKRLGKRTRKNHNFSIDAVDNLLISFGYHLTKKQLEQLEDLIRQSTSSNTSPIFSHGLASSRSTKSKSRLFKFKHYKKRRRKEKPKTQDDVQPVRLREIEICQQIGCGASSAGVYLCVVDGWSCAMKQLKRELVGQLDIKCFEREMDILYRLPPHPNIVRYLFHTSHGRELCLFMQLYSGTLRDLLDERRRKQELFPAELVAEMALEIAHGIQFLHKHNVIHRDIKAGNIFITRNENGDVTKLAVGDFDTSLRVQASQMNLRNKDIIRNPAQSSSSSSLFSNFKRQPSSSSTKPINSTPRVMTTEKRNHFAANKPRSTVGTAGFMAPEVLGSGGNTPYGFKADIYSFGMVLYEMVTLKLPFEQLDTCDIITAVLEGEPVESMKIDDKIRDNYWTLVDLHHKCTSSQPQTRPSWKTIIDTLTSVVKGESSNHKPVLTSQKSKMSLTAQLNLYEFDCDSTRFDSIEEIEEKNSSLRFGGPQALATTENEISESTEAEIEISMPVYSQINRLTEEKTKEIIRQSPKQPRGRGFSGEHSEGSSHGARKFTRKIILEIKDSDGNVIREEIVENSEEESASESPPTKQPRQKKKRTKNSKLSRSWSQNSLTAEHKQSVE